MGLGYKSAFKAPGQARPCQETLLLCRPEETSNPGQSLAELRVASTVRERKGPKGAESSGLDPCLASVDSVPVPEGPVSVTLLFCLSFISVGACSGKLNCGYYCLFPLREAV